MSLKKNKISSFYYMNSIIKNKIEKQKELLNKIIKDVDKEGIYDNNIKVKKIELKPIIEAVDWEGNIELD